MGRYVAWKRSSGCWIIRVCPMSIAASSWKKTPQRPQLVPRAGAVSFSLGAPRLPGTNGGLPNSGIVSGVLFWHLETTHGQPRPRPAQRWGRFLSAMRYRDIEYTVIQGSPHRPPLSWCPRRNAGTFSRAHSLEPVGTKAFWGSSHWLGVPLRSWLW